MKYGFETQLWNDDVKLLELEGYDENIVWRAQCSMLNGQDKKEKWIEEFIAPFRPYLLFIFIVFLTWYVSYVRGADHEALRVQSKWWIFILITKIQYFFLPSFGNSFYFFVYSNSQSKSYMMKMAIAIEMVLRVQKCKFENFNMRMWL